MEHGRWVYLSSGNDHDSPLIDYNVLVSRFYRSQRHDRQDHLLSVFCLRRCWPLSFLILNAMWLFEYLINCHSGVAPSNDEDRPSSSPFVKGARGIFYVSMHRDNASRGMQEAEQGTDCESVNFPHRRQDGKAGQRRQPNVRLRACSPVFPLT